MANTLLLMGAFIVMPTAHAMSSLWCSERAVIWAKRAVALGAEMMCAGLFMKGMGHG